MTQPDLARLEGLVERATGTGSFAIRGMERPLPWEVWTSNSFRRVKTECGIDVLSGYRCSDGCVDLSMPEERLVALIELTNSLPALLARVRELESALTVAEESLDQMLDDMGDTGKCVCQFAKDEATAALVTVRAALNRSETDAG